MKILILKILILGLNIIYLPFKLLKTQEKIVMISRQSNEVNDDFRLLGNELSKNFKVVYLCRTLDGGVNSNLITKINYAFHIFTQLYHLATSKICVLDTYCLAACVLKHKKNLKIVQIWHSIGTLKQFGWQILGRGEGSNPEIAKTMKMHKNYDVVYCAGEVYKKVLSEGFNLPVEKFRVFTLPRIDLLKNEDFINKTRADIFEKYPMLKEKENVVYAPTFRKDETDFNDAFQKLSDAFDFEKYNLILKLHPLSKVSVTNENVVLDKSFSTFQMIAIADKFISDYSCVVYEAGVKGVPLYFYNYDMSTYEDVRSLTIDYNDLPGVKTADAKELTAALNDDYDFEYLEKYIRKYVENTNDCAKKMAEDILGLIDNRPVI